MIKSTLRTLMFVGFVSVAGTGQAEDAVTQKVIAEMAAQGFSQVQVSKTLFGRTKIRGLNADFVHLVILDPKTGKILKDKTIARSDTGSGNTPDGTGLSVDGNPE